MPTIDWSSADAVALAVLARHHGVAHISAFKEAGLTRHQIAAIFRRGVMNRPRNGWFADPAVPWQGRHAVRVGGLLACVSAVQAYGLPVPPQSWAVLHVAVHPKASHLRHNRDRRREVRAGDDAEVELHWVQLVDPAEGWRTSLVDALLHLVDCVPDDWFIAALDAALHRPRDGEPIMSDEEYARLRSVLPRKKRALLELVNPLSGSCLETLIRLGLGRRGIGPLTLQFSPAPYTFVDLLVGRVLIVEADGKAYHDPEQDALRDAQFRSLGYTVLRFTYDEIVFDLQTVLDRIEETLASL